jgi:hypothetical protein
MDRAEDRHEASELKLSSDQAGMEQKKEEEEGGDREDHDTSSCYAIRCK